MARSTQLFLYLGERLTEAEEMPEKGLQFHFEFI